MKHIVIWTPVAEQRLAQVWLDAADRDAVREAANRIDAELEAHPVVLGESRSGPTRVAFEGPLGVLFEVIEAPRRVRVLSIWRCR
jgi:plasmid stabilization system protein ParE